MMELWEDDVEIGCLKEKQRKIAGVGWIQLERVGEKERNGENERNVQNIKELARFLTIELKNTKI